ncbi:MAG: endo-1,4-beta-xylanase [Cyclobacteriaceae bacterium]
MTHQKNMVAARVGLLLLYMVFGMPLVEAQSAQQWYDQAQDRIDTLRKGTYAIQVLDANGQPYDGQVKVRMKKHEFPFGIAFDFYEGKIDTEVPTETQWMKAVMYKYFNYGVSGNSFKWSGIDPNGNGPNYTNFENALTWTKSVGWELRAHTLLWGGSEGDNHAMPQWVTNLGSANRVFEECEERVKREVGRYDGHVQEFDVINEPLHATYTQDLYGDSLNWKSFEWAAQANPEAKLFINEYNVEFSWGDLDQYYTLIDNLLARGTPISGIGIQAHFWDCCRPSLNDVLRCLDRLGEFGLPIKLTEFDFGGNLTEAEQASDLILIYTTAFSHPSVNGVVYWNLADHLSWRENAGLLKENHTPKLAADTLLYLTKTLWATNFEQGVDANGELTFDAYHGDYVIEVEFDGIVKQFTVPLHSDREGEVFTLSEDEADMKHLEMVDAQMNSLDAVTITYDQPVNPETISKFDFKVFTPNAAALISASVIEGESNKVLLQLDRSVSVLDYVTLSYFPGTLSATSGALAEAFGVEEVQINADLNQVPVVESDYYEFEMSKNAPGGTQLGVITGEDPEGVDITYKIISGDHLGVFGVGRESGLLVLLNPFYLNFDENPAYNLIVGVSDGVHIVNVEVVITPTSNVLSDKPLTELLIYPNPSQGTLFIQSPIYFNDISVYDISGREVIQQQLVQMTKQAKIEVNRKPGIFYIQLSGNGEEQVSKVIIE